MLHAIFVEPLVILLRTSNVLFMTLHIPDSWGWAIILVTVVLRLVTLPLTFSSMKSMRRMQELQPEIEKLKKKYGKDQQKMMQAQQELYKEAGVNPLGGCLPMLVQWPILFGFYYAIRDLASGGELVKVAWWFIPDLSFPYIGAGLKWIYPFPPSIKGGWMGALPYLVLPVLLMVSQVVMQWMSTNTAQQSSQNKMMNQMMWLMSIMFAYITLTLPSALSLYWVTSNLLGIGQQYFVNKAAAQAAPVTVGAQSNIVEVKQQPSVTKKKKKKKKGK